MAWPDDFYSQLVAWMKIILPLAALGLLSTLFLLSRTIDPAGSIPTAQIDLEQRAHDLGVTNPSFAGVTSGGDQVTLQAARARPDPKDPQHLMAFDIKAQLRLVSGAVIDIRSDNANMHQRRLTITLDGNVHVITTTGYDITTDRLNTRFDELYVETTGPITATGAPGDLTAGKMLLVTDKDTGRAHLLFTQGVKLIYSANKTKE